LRTDSRDLLSEFIFEEAPFASAHASTIAETPEGMVAAWFGGPREGNPGVGIWLARKADAQWSAPVELARGTDRRGRSQPCWNPVLHQATGGPLLLFYKVGPSPRRWWGMLSASTDGGRTWSAARRLPRGILGPIKNKPIVLDDGSLLCPSSTEHLGWRAHLERTTDLGESWEKLGPLNGWRDVDVIQPSILPYPEGRMQVLCRTRQRVIAACWSSDGGRSWGPMQATLLPNPAAASTRLRFTMVARCSRTTPRRRPGRRSTWPCPATACRGAMFACSRTGAASTRIRLSSKTGTAASM
jgi:predicted neuraminidase